MASETQIFEELTLEVVAQQLMDLYYKEFAPENAFFEIDIFIYVCRAAWGKLIDEECRQWRRVAKEETGFYTIELGSEWLISETHKVQGGHSITSFLDLNDLPYGFAWDKWSYGIQALSSVDYDYSVLERITFDTTWKQKHLPKTKKVYWYPLRNKIIFLAQQGLVGKNIDVHYLPSMTTVKNAALPVGKIADILSIGYAVMKQTYQAVVDKSNNGNPNAPLQTEVDNVFAGIGTKQV